MANFLKLHLHPLGGRIIFWNFVLLILVKLVFPYSAFQSASLLGLTPTFDSREIITATNEARTASHLPELKPNVKLDLAASDKLNDMANKEYFAHVSPTGIDPWYWVKKSDYRYSVAGENLAIGFVSATDTVQAWLNSPSHRANLLNNKYRDIGVAVANVEINDRKGILIVQMFGLPAEASAKAGKPTGQTVAVSQTPASTPLLLNPTPVQIAVASSIPQTQGESITVSQEVSTDKSIDPIPAPIVVKYQDAEKITKVSGILNSIYSAYALVITAVSAIAFLFFEKSKRMAFKMALNFALFLLALIIPTSKIILEGLVF